MTLPVRIAVIGAGQFGVLHARTLARLPGAQLSAIVDPDTERVKPFAEELGVHYYPDLQDLIDDEAAEAVVIATRADSHLGLAKQALYAGLGVLVEKPLANSAAEIQEFIKETGELARNVMVNHLCLFHSLVAPLVQRIDHSGFRALHFVRHRPDHIGRHYPEDHPIQLTMVHDLYVAARLVHAEDPVYFHALDSRNQQDRVDMSWATLRWKDGRTATFHCHMGLPDGVPAEGWDSLEIFGEGFHSKVITNPAPWTWSDQQTTWPVNLEMSEIQGIPSGMLAGVHHAFVAACRGEEVPLGCRVEDALQIQQWIDRLLEISNSSL